jgi:hypothetical protein
MVNNTLVLENRRVVMERKCKLVHQHQSSNNVLPHLQLDLFSVLLSLSCIRDLSQLARDSLPRSAKCFSAPTIYKFLLPEIRMFRGPKLLTATTPAPTHGDNSIPAATK